MIGTPRNLVIGLVVVASLATLVDTASAFTPDVLRHVRTTTCKKSRSFSSSDVLPINTRPPHPLITVCESAKIMPFAYTAASASLLFRASKGVDSKADIAVLLSTAALSLFNLGPTDNARLASAKRAVKKTSPESSELAKNWRSLVRIKLIGQLVGLVWMAIRKQDVMRGAATVMATNVAFLLGGGGDSKHDDEGDPAPMSSSQKTTVFVIDTSMTAAAIVAAASPLQSSRRAVASYIFAGGIFIGALEGVANLIFSRGRSSSE